jgi:hypothetical protein
MRLTLHAGWQLAIATTLIAAQLALLGFGLLDPHVSKGYRALFIDHTMMTEPYESHTFIWPGPDTVPETAVPTKSS